MNKDDKIYPWFLAGCIILSIGIIVLIYLTWKSWPKNTKENYYKDRPYFKLGMIILLLFPCVWCTEKIDILNREVISITKTTRIVEK